MAELVNYLRLFDWGFTLIALSAALLMLKDINQPVCRIGCANKS
jgi:hypothetical protein